MLGFGAFYIIEGQLTAGAMIAASIIMARGLAPIEQAITGWKTMLDAYAGFKRLREYMAAPVARQTQTNLPKPTGVVQVESLSFAVDSRSEPILHDIKFTLTKGQVLAVVGPSGAGKSTLARLLVGVWQPSYGSVRFDGVDVFHWQAAGEHIGYLAQSTTLFPTTVKHNIARMQPGDQDAIVQAAEFVNAHQFILHLPKGYEAETTGYQLSAGQRQRIALARAFYSMPCYVVLDEPESNLDQDGIVSLQQAIQKAREQGTTIVMITQHPGLVKLADQALVLKAGRMQDYGPSADILTKWLGGHG